MEAPQTHPNIDNYEQILSHMQKYDCSFQEAQTQLSNPDQHMYPDFMHQQLKQIQHFQSLIANQAQELAQQTSNAVAMTQMELAALQMFLKGNNRLALQKTGLQKMFPNASKKLRQLKKKLRCLKCLNPKTYWQRYRSRNKQYKQVNLQQSTYSEKAKPQISHEPTNYKIADDDLQTILDDFKQQLLELLEKKSSLANSIRSIALEGITIADPPNLILSESLKPLVIVQQKAINQLRNNTGHNLQVQMQTIQQKLAIIIVSKQKYRSLFAKVQQFSQTKPFTFCFYNIFGELQVLQLLPAIPLEKVEQIQKAQVRLIVKNALFHLMQSGRGNQIRFQIQQSEPYQYQDYQQQEEDSTPSHELQAQKALRDEQNMLYQSMLQQHTTRKNSEQLQSKAAHAEKQRKKALRQKVGEQPTHSTETYNFTFRTPNGAIVCRNFMKNDQLQLLYDWIQTQEAIQFEDEERRHFQLCYGFPPQNITADRTANLSTVFNEQQSRIKLIIRQI